MKRKSLLIMLLVALFVPSAMNAQNRVRNSGTVGSVDLEMRASANEMPSNPLLAKLQPAKEAALEELNGRGGTRGSSTVTASRITSATATWTGSEGESWSVVINGGTLNQAVTNGYAQYGIRNGASTSGTFSTSGISGTITSIDVDCASYSGRGTVSVTVGGSAFGSSQSIPNWSNNAGGTRTFMGSASGNIVVTMTNASNGRAMYIKSITVTYSPVGCSVPEDFAATSVTSNSATLSWTETGTSDSWVIYYMAEDDEDVSYEVANTNPYTLTGLDPLTTYYALVTPNCGDLDQDSDVITFTTADLPCPMPSNLATSDITANSATFSWTGEGESYNLQYRTPGGREIFLYEDFEGDWPGDWTETSIGSNTGVYSGAPNSGTYMYGFMANGTRIQYLISPELSNIEEGSVVAFYHLAYQANATIYVGYSSTTTATNQFTWGSAQTVTASTSYAMYAMEIPAGTKYVGIRVNALSSSAYYFVDDFFVAGPYVEPGEWHTAENVTSPYTATGLDPETDYEWQVQAVCGGGDGESLWAESDIFTTLSACGAPISLTASNITNNSAALSWTGFTDTYNIQYREVTDPDPNTPATLILNVPSDIWGDGTGYQLILDADHNTYGSTIPETSSFTAGSFAEFEYTIPENAVCNASTNTIIVNGSATITIPAGVYDFAFLNPDPSSGTYYIASNQGSFPGRGDDYEFEAGKTYEFVLSIVGQNDNIDVTITDNGNPWIPVNNVTNPYTLSGLNPDTQYEFQVQGANCDGNGNTSDWSASAFFTTINGTLVESISADDVTVVVGATASITNLSVLPADATNTAVTYTSNDETIATVDENGVVTGVGVGNTTITIAATDGSNVTATINVTVNGIDVTGITAENVTLVNGETAQISYTVAPNNATDASVTFTSANTNIATVDADGAVTGVGVGETTITIASVSNPEVTAEITVTVTSNPNAVQFTVNAPANAHPGEVITVEGVLAAPTSGTWGGFTDLAMGIYYDNTAFEYVANSMAYGPVAQQAQQLNSFMTPSTTTDAVLLGINCFNYGSFVTAEGVVFSAQFTVLDGAEGEYTFTAQPNNAGNFDHEGVLIPYEATPSTVEVAELVTFTKDITHWSDDGGFYLIASPVSTTPAEVTNMITTPANTYDLYMFNPKATFADDGHTYEWENYKQHSFPIVPGKGYLYANNNDVQLIFSGTLYDGNGEVELHVGTYSHLGGMNLVGNPFTQIAYIADGREFYTMNSAGSQLEVATGNSIEAMEGVFVNAEDDGETMQFTTTAPQGSKSGVILNVTQGRSNIDRAIVRFDGNSQLPKFQLFENTTKLYIPQGTNEFAVVNADAQGELPVNFKAQSNGTYTLSVNAENLEFNYLHLIDNMTGDDVDLLVNPSYSFNANTYDYESRFKLVFAQGNSDNNAEFAFISDGNLIVNGEGLLQVIDMTGRVISTSQVNGMSSIKLNAAAGVYVLKLNDKTQKIVLK